MIIYSYRAPDHGSESRWEPPVAPGVSRVRFGKETLFCSDGPSDTPPAQTASRGARLPSREVEGTREQLHIVVQNGRLFEQHHPDVAVLHDRGRFLLVRLDPERAQRIAAEGETCYGILPLADNDVAFEELDRSSARAPAAAILTLLAKLSPLAVEKRVKKLVSFGTRHSTSAGFASAVTWAREQLGGMGYSTALQDVTVPGGTARNLIANRAGTGTSRKLVLVTAHLDSINMREGPTGPAPGADDNASGCAGLLEIAGVLKDRPSRHDLRLILFGGEEQGLFGSKQHVSSLSVSERSRITAVVNMDMIGSVNTVAPSVLLEGSVVSQSVVDGLSEAADTYTQLKVETSLKPANSDHVPFIKAGIPAVLTIEGADSTNETVHSADDTLPRINYQLLLEILRMNVAFVADSLS